MFYDLVDALERHSDSLSQFDLGQAEWFKKFQKKHFTRMRWRAFGG